MDHHVAVQIADGSAYLEKQSDLLPKTKPCGIDVDGCSFNVLHDEVRLAVLAMTGVQQTGDVGMRERGQDLSLRQKPLAQLGAVGAGPQKFHGDALRHLTIDSLRRV